LRRCTDVTPRSLLRVLTQAEEREDCQNHDDQADKINQSIHAPLLVQWRSEHKTAHKEESSGTAETRDRSATKSARSRHRRWRLKGARQQRQIRHSGLVSTAIGAPVLWALPVAAGNGFFDVGSTQSENSTVLRCGKATMASPRDPPSLAHRATARAHKPWRHGDLCEILATNGAGPRHPAGLWTGHWSTHARRFCNFSPSRAMSMAKAMMAVFADRCSRGHTTTYCLSMRAI